MPRDNETIEGLRSDVKIDNVNIEYSTDDDGSKIAPSQVNVNVTMYVHVPNDDFWGPYNVTFRYSPTTTKRKGPVWTGTDPYKLHGKRMNERLMYALPEAYRMVYDNVVHPTVEDKVADQPNTSAEVVTKNLVREIDNNRLAQSDAQYLLNELETYIEEGDEE